MGGGAARGGANGDGRVDDELGSAEGAGGDVGGARGDVGGERGDVGGGLGNVGGARGGLGGGLEDTGGVFGEWDGGRLDPSVLVDSVLGAFVPQSSREGPAPHCCGDSLLRIEDVCHAQEDG